MLEKLWNAIIENNLTEIKRLLSLVQPHYLLQPVENHMTVLHLAAHIGNVEAFKAIVNKSSYTLGTVCMNGEYIYWSALTFAANCDKDKGSVEIFDIIKSMQPQKFEQAIISCGQTLLHFATAKGKSLLCKWLADNNEGANTTLDVQGILPIHQAILKQHTEVLKILIDKLPESYFSKFFEAKGTLVEFAIKCGNETACLYLIPRASPESFVQKDLINLAKKAGMRTAESFMVERTIKSSLMIQQLKITNALIRNLNDEVEKLKLDSTKLLEIQSMLGNTYKIIKSSQNKINYMIQVGNEASEDCKQDIQVEPVSPIDQPDVCAVGVTIEHCVSGAWGSD